MFLFTPVLHKRRTVSLILFYTVLEHFHFIYHVIFIDSALQVHYLSFILSLLHSFSILFSSFFLRFDIFVRGFPQFVTLQLKNALYRFGVSFSSYRKNPNQWISIFFQYSEKLLEILDTQILRYLIIKWVFVQNKHVNKTKKLGKSLSTRVAHEIKHLKFTCIHTYTHPPRVDWIVQYETQLVYWERKIIEIDIKNIDE